MSRNKAPIGACWLRSGLVVIYMDLRARALASLQRSLSVDVPRMSIETKTSIHLLRGSRMLRSVVRRSGPTVVVPVHPGPLLSFGVGMNDQVAPTAASSDARCVVVLVAFPHATVVRVHHIFTTSIADASHVRWRIVGRHRSMLRGRLRLRMRWRMLCRRLQLRMR
jgi:hypothetical protein